MKTIPLDLHHITASRFLLFLFAIILTLIIGNAVATLLMNIMHDRVRKPYAKLISKLAMYGVYSGGLYVAMTRIISFNLPAALAALGVFGAFCFVPTIPILQNAIAGIFVAFTRPFTEGDLVDVGGEMCEVLDLMLIKTRLKGRDGRILLLPNVSFITGNIINYSRGRFLKISAALDVKNSTAPEAVTVLVEDVCAASPDIIPNVPDSGMNRLQRLFMERTNMEKLKPSVFVKGITADKNSYDIWFWTWNIAKKETVVSSFYREVRRLAAERSMELA